MKYTLLKSKVDNFILLLDEGLFDVNSYSEIEKELLEISFLYHEEDKIEKKNSGNILFFLYIYIF